MNGEQMLQMENMAGFLAPFLWVWLHNTSDSMINMNYEIHGASVPITLLPDSVNWSMVNTVILGKVILIQIKGCGWVQAEIPAQAVALADLRGSKLHTNARMYPESRESGQENMIFLISFATMHSVVCIHSK